MKENLINIIGTFVIVGLFIIAIFFRDEIGLKIPSILGLTTFLIVIIYNFFKKKWFAGQQNAPLNSDTFI